MSEQDMAITAGQYANPNNNLEPDYRDFVMTVEGLFSEQECAAMREGFELMVEAGFGQNGGNGYGQDGGFDLKRRKDQVVYSGDVCGPENKTEGVTEVRRAVKNHAQIMEKVWNCWMHYSAEYGISEMVHLSDVKWQKTEPGGGFHVWHHERGRDDYRDRVAVWMVYLNDIEDGGETEFLHQGVRIKPKEGTFLLWPAGYTHPHRGNPPLKEDKYILTGWVEY